MRPASISSSPAMQRSKVVLPQPEGPTKTMNSPASMSRSMPWRMRGPEPYCFSMPRSVMEVMSCLLLESTGSALDGARGEALDQAAGVEDEQHQQRQHGHGRACADGAPGRLAGALQRAQH